MHPTDLMHISMKKERNIFLWELENFFTVVFNSANDCNRKELINLDIPFLNYLHYNLLLETDSFNPTYQVHAVFVLFLEITSTQMWEARFPSVQVLFLSEILSTLTIMLYFLPDFLNSKYETKQTEVSLLCKTSSYFSKVLV